MKIDYEINLYDWIICYFVYNFWVINVFINNWCQEASVIDILRDYICNISNNAKIIIILPEFFGYLWSKFFKLYLAVRN